MKWEGEKRKKEGSYSKRIVKIDEVEMTLSDREYEDEGKEKR